MRRAIQRYIENPLSSKIISGEVKDGDRVRVSVDKDALVFNVTGDAGTGEVGDEDPATGAKKRKRSKTTK